MDDDDEGFGDIGTNRYQAMPSLMALQQMKNRLHTAYLGKRLMKWTAMACGKEMRELASVITENRVLVLETKFQEAYMTLARSRYFMDDLHILTLCGVGNKAFVTIEKHPRFIAGAKLTTYQIKDAQKDDGTVIETFQHFGIGRGGIQVRETKKIWRQLLYDIIYMTELVHSFQAVFKAFTEATKKKNVMQKVVIPKTIHTIQYIQRELEELGREDFYRMKMIKNLKIRSRKTEPKRQVEIEDEFVKRDAYVRKPSREEQFYIQESLSEESNIEEGIKDLKKTVEIIIPPRIDRPISNISAEDEIFETEIKSEIIEVECPFHMDDAFDEDLLREALEKQFYLKSLDDEAVLKLDTFDDTASIKSFKMVDDVSVKSLKFDESTKNNDDKVSVKSLKFKEPRNANESPALSFHKDSVIIAKKYLSTHSKHDKEQIQFPIPEPLTTGIDKIVTDIVTRKVADCEHKSAQLHKVVDRIIGLAEETDSNRFDDNFTCDLCKPNTKIVKTGTSDNTLVLQRTISINGGVCNKCLDEELKRVNDNDEESWSDSNGCERHLHIVRSQELKAYSFDFSPEVKDILNEFRDLKSQIKEIAPSIHNNPCSSREPCRTVQNQEVTDNQEYFETSPYDPDNCSSTSTASAVSTVSSKRLFLDKFMPKRAKNKNKELEKKQ